MDLGEIFRLLPTKEDIRAMVAIMEDAHSREVRDIKGGLGHLVNPIDSTDGEVIEMDTRMRQLEQAQGETEALAMDIRLQEEKGR